VYTGAAALASTFSLPHSVTVAEDRGEVCVADRENGRLQCFDFFGKLHRLIRAPQLEPTLYAVSYDKFSGWYHCFKAPSIPIFPIFSYILSVPIIFLYFDEIPIFSYIIFTPKKCRDARMSRHSS